MKDYKIVPYSTILVGNKLNIQLNVGVYDICCKLEGLFFKLGYSINVIEKHQDNFKIYFRPVTTNINAVTVRFHTTDIRDYEFLKFILPHLSYLIKEIN